MKKKAFRDLITNIKPGEVWEGDILYISCDSEGHIKLESKDGKPLSYITGFYYSGAEVFGYVTTDKTIEKRSKEKVSVKNNEKSYMDVLADIKEDEVWESELLIITKDGKDTKLRFKNDDRFNSFKLKKDDKYTLRRYYTFEEALRFREENGMSIISDVTHKLVECDEFNPKFTYNEIKGKWYIEW